MKLQHFEFSTSDVIPANVQNISHLVSFAFFVSFIEKSPPIKFYGILDHFSQTYEVAKFYVIKLYLYVSNVINVNEHTKYANCGLHVNSCNFLLMPFCLMMKKDQFKQKLLL